MYTSAYNAYFNQANIMNALAAGSNSMQAAQERASEYAKLFSNYEGMCNDLRQLISNTGSGVSVDDATRQRLFSGYAETPMLGTQYFNSSVAAYVSSWAGIISVERTMDQPNGIFYWQDVLGVTDMRPVSPNLGPDILDFDVMGKLEHNVTVTNNAAYTTLLGRKIIPGSIRIKITTTTEKFELIDNGQGTLVAPPNRITAATINYLNGRIDFTLVAALTMDPKESILVVGKEDTLGTPSMANGASNGRVGAKRVLAKFEQLSIPTVPDSLILEYNIATVAGVKKATNTDPAQFLFNQLRSLYTKSINKNMVNVLEEGYKGNVMTDLDLSEATLNGKFYDYQSRLDMFDAYQTNVESTLAAKAVKGCSITFYVAGLQASNQFQKSKKWTKNTKLSYVNDLLGWYDGIPVLRSTDIVEAAGEGTFYAGHKTPGGEMAPLARGMFLPLTETPIVGNYSNPTQMTGGLYYQEGVRNLAPELVQKVTFKMGF